MASDEELRGRLLNMEAQALTALTVGSRDVNLEEALLCLRSAVALPSSTAAEAADRLNNLASVYSQRSRGDARTNRAAAIGRYEEALEMVAEAENPALVAALRTNLALTLRARAGRSNDDLARARRLLEQALTWRSPERDGYEWGYSQVNLGVVLTDIADENDAPVNEAVSAYQRVVDERERIGTPWMVANAELNLARLLLRHAEQPDEDEATDEAQLEERQAVLLQAEDLLRSAAHGSRERPDILGRVLRQLAGVEEELEKDPMTTYGRAVELMRSHGSAGELADASGELAALHADRGDWLAAADLYRVAVADHASVVRSQFSAPDRSTHVQAGPQLSRWASHALLRVGAVQEAVSLLEQGLAYELRQRLGADASDLRRLREADPALASEYQQVMTAIAASPIDDSASSLGQRADRLRQDIRLIPGLDTFHDDPSFMDVAKAADPEQPIIYVNPTPSGTDLVLVTHDHRVDVVTLQTTSRQIVDRVLFGADRDFINELGDALPPSFVLAAVHGSADQMATALTAVTSWVGEHIARHINTALNKVQAKSVTLVLCGPLQRLPVAACPWGPDEQCLLAQRAVVLAPSASLHIAAKRSRDATRQGENQLTFIGDPSPDSEEHALPGAALEERRIQSAAPWSLTSHTGTHATREALTEALSNGGVVHLCCHASADITDINAVGLLLHDGPMKVAELATLDAARTRLVTLSACQTAVMTVDREVEALSLGTVLVAAGAAGVIASLWSVDDVATALLMGRFYEILFSEGRNNPAGALREAQLWLRDLPRETLADVLTRDPRLGDLEIYDEASDDPGRPFAHMEYWGAFVAFGT